MATGTEILSYEGSSGLGSNPDIPAIGVADLSVINNSLDRISTQNAAQNLTLFNQKVKDRDALYAALDSGEIAVGDILEQDMPTVKEGLQALDDAYFKRIQNGVNDLDAAREYNKAVREAKDRVTQAQARKKYADDFNVAISKETLPRKQEAMKKSYEENINKGFFKDLIPYQQAQDLDIQGSILSTSATASEAYKDPNNPLLKGTRTYFDYDKTLQNNKNNFLNDLNKRHDQQQLITSIQSLPPAEFLDTINALNNRINEYNTVRGFAQGQPGFVEKVNIEVDPNTGRGLIRENISDFAAKFTLGNQQQFQALGSELDEAAFKIQQQKDKVRHEKAQEAIGRTNAGANAMRAKAYVALQNKKLSDLTEDEKRVKNFWGGITKNVKQRGLNSGSGTVVGDYVFAGDLPKGYRLVGGLDKDGKPIELIPKKTPSGVEYYDTKYFDSNGGELDLMAQFKEYQKQGGKGSYDDLRNKLLNSGSINMEIVGTNGVGNFETAFQAARALSNKLTTKGEEPIFTDENE